MTTLIRTTADGRKVEVIGLAICLDGRLEAYELIPLAEHPNRHAIAEAAPDATHMAGRLALNAEEAVAVKVALEQAETEILTNPTAIGERFRLAQQRRARAEGIE